MKQHVAGDSSADETVDENWLASLGLVAAGCDIEAQSQLASLRQVSAAWPRVLIAQLFACALIVASALNHNTFGLFSGAGLLALSTLPTSIVSLLILRSSAGGNLSPHGRYRLLSALAAILGLSTCFAIIELSQYDNGFSASLLAAGMAVAGLVTYTALLPMRVTMLAFVTSFGGAILYEESDLVVTLVGGALLICVWFVGIALMRNDIDRVADRRDNDVRSRRATRLLEEFESRGDGWFWETNENGEISYLSQKFIELLKRPKADVLGKPLADIMIARGDTQDGERTLNFHMTTRTPFADITVRTTVLGKELHWTISGRPIMDESGRFRGYAGGGADLTEKLRSEREVKRLARFDELTGLNNRQQMRETLAEVLGESGRPAQNVALFLLDLDRFKSVNDTMGHPIGDALLKKASERLMSTVGGMGHVGRLGGDEFEVVLPGEIQKERLDELAQSIIYQLSQPYMIDGTAITIGCSIGIARAPEAATNSENLVRNADIALYAAKEDGRGVHRFYERQMHNIARKRKQLEDDLRNALSNDQLHLCYQPVVRTTNAQIVGYEALIRWNHPITGAISPAEFIPVAEDIRLIERIGEWVLRTACLEAAKWGSHVRIAVNVSPVQFANPAFPSIVTSALAASQIAPDRLELEITEGVFLDESVNTDKMFKALKALGIRLALDDFGTGYSSLGYLKKAPFDKIKIDQSFIRGAAVSGNRNAAIVKAIVTLAEALHMETTAEGVELEDEIELIRELGCSHMQGYIYGKPMLAEEALLQQTDTDGFAQPSGFKASRSPRTKTLRLASVTISGNTIDGRIRNISETGAMFEGASNVEVGSDLLIEIMDGEMIPAQVRWSEEDRMGVQFARSFDLENLSATIDKLPYQKVAKG